MIICYIMLKILNAIEKKKQNWRTGHIREAMHPVQHLVDWVGVLFFCFHVQLNESQVLYLPMSVPIPSKASIWGKIIQCHKKMCHNLSKQRSPPRWLTGQESTSVSWLTGIRCPKSGKKKKAQKSVSQSVYMERRYLVLSKTSIRHLVYARRSLMFGHIWHCSKCP